MAQGMEQMERDLAPMNIKSTSKFAGILGNRSKFSSESLEFFHKKASPDFLSKKESDWLTRSERALENKAKKNKVNNLAFHDYRLDFIDPDEKEYQNKLFHFVRYQPYESPKPRSPQRKAPLGKLKPRRLFD